MGTLRVAVVVTESENPNQIHEKPSHRHNLTRTSHFTNSEHCVRTTVYNLLNTIRLAGNFQIFANFILSTKVFSFVRSIYVYVY